MQVCESSAEMWTSVIYLCLFTWVTAQTSRTILHQEHNGHGWDIRLAVPGEPGNDYPTLGNIPRTSFSCAGKEPGYYADLETNCQVFRVCTVGSTYGFQSFLCPNGTLFNQAVLVCDWWMNVDCESSQQFLNYNKEKFENLRLGPELMKDIKKMLTHPMLNPYDRNAMKSNLVVMQDYKPPAGQLFPNGALLAGPERLPNNVYVPAKQIKHNFINNNPNDILISASTPDPRFISGLGDDNYFQRQKQSNQNIRIGRMQNTQSNGNIISNSHTGRFLQNPDFNNNNIYTQLPQHPKPTQTNSVLQRQKNSARNNQFSNTQNSHKSEVNNRRHPQYTKPRGPHSDNEKQNNFNIAFSEKVNSQNLNTSQAKPSYIQSTTSSILPQFSNSVNNRAGKELKENLALVYSFLTDSINVAREYNNFAQQEILSSTMMPTPAQFANFDSKQLSDISSRISELTSSQYSRNAKYSKEPTQARQMQPPQYNTPLQNTQSELYSARSPTLNDQHNLQNNQVYSGQLYQWPVYEQNTNSNTAANTLQQPNPAIEIIKATTVPIYSAKLQLESADQQHKRTSQETLTDLLNSENGISAHLQDKIVGTIPHPLENNKVVTYEKDQSYYLYTKFDDKAIVQNPSTNLQSDNDSKQNSNLIQDINKQNSVSFELIPSLNYELEDENEQQNILNSFQIDEFGAPREIIKNTNANNSSEDKSPRQLLTSNIDFAVEHPTSMRRSDRYNIDTLYSGPSSYTAPQLSIGSLERVNSQNNFNSRLEDFDTNSAIGYSKERPARQFIF